MKAPIHKDSSSRPRTRVLIVADQGDSEQSGTAVKLSITHTIEREPSKFIAAAPGGWPKVISNLKSLLETGSTVLRDPYPTGNQR